MRYNDDIASSNSFFFRWLIKIESILRRNNKIIWKIHCFAETRHHKCCKDLTVCWNNICFNKVILDLWYIRSKKNNYINNIRSDFLVIKFYIQNLWRQESRVRQLVEEYWMVHFKWSFIIFEELPRSFLNSLNYGSLKIYDFSENNFRKTSVSSIYFQSLVKARLWGRRSITVKVKVLFEAYTNIE